MRTWMDASVELDNQSVLIYLGIVPIGYLEGYSHTVRALVIDREGSMSFRVTMKTEDSRR